MKLKLVVASLSVLGLISSSAFAAHTKHHGTKKHHEATVANIDYKAMGALPVAVCPINDPYSVTLDIMGQNTGRAKPTEDCMKMISIAGGMNFDAHWGNLSTGYQGENMKRLALNDAYLNAFGNVNDWTKAFVSLSYNDVSDVNINNSTLGQYSKAYRVDSLTVEQGFIQFSNFNQSPFFAKVGKLYTDFGRYTIHPLTRSLTQVLSETLQTAAQVGFVAPMGLHGDVYSFDNPLRPRYAYALDTVQGHSTPNFGAALGFDQGNDQLNWGVNVGYLYNMTGVNDVSQAVSQYQSFGVVSTTGGSYNNRVGAASLDAYVGSGPFSLKGDYVSALQTFSNNDLGSKGMTAVAAGTGSGAKPWAGNLQAGYNFNGWSHNQNVYLGYQASGDAVNVFLPKNRWVVGYNVDMWKNANIGLELDHDNDYSAGQGGTGNNTNIIGVRGAVKFG